MLDALRAVVEFEDRADQDMTHGNRLWQLQAIDDIRAILATIDKGDA